MNIKMQIGICKNDHYFFAIGSKCPYCKSPIEKKIPFREGDCIYCGPDHVMCPGHAYGCNNPTPLSKDDYLKANKKK